MRRIVTKNIFLSSTARDLEKYREAIYTAIESLEGYHCVRMEDFTSRSQNPLSYLNELIPGCELFIALVGLCYGSCPQGSDTSFTEHEYNRAKEKGIPRLVFLLPDDFSLPANLVTGKGGWNKKQKGFRNKVREDVICKTFNNPDQAAMRVVASIMNWKEKKDKPVRRRGRGSYKAMDCIILCGGYASRLWPLTLDISKVTLPIANKPVLSHVLDFVTKSKLIRNVVLSVNKKYAQQIAAFADDSRPDGRIIKVITEPELGPEGKLGPIGAINYVVKKIGSRDLLVLGGDNLFGFELEDFQRFAARWDKSVNALFQFPSHEDTREYGVASLNSEDVFVDFQEKSALTSYRNVSTACYLFRHADIKSLQKYVSEGHDTDSLGNFIGWLVSKGRPPIGYKFNKFWFDVGTPEKLLAANRQFILDHHRGNYVNSSLKSPVLIHETATVEESNVGPDVSFGPNTRVSGSEVSNSILLEGAVVRNSRLSNSIVGPGSIIVKSHVTGLVCGPNSKVDHDM